LNEAGLMDEELENEDELPRVLELLWRRVDRRARSPQQPLTLERIVAAAIEIADAEGLAGLSMARLAERLGCATMSLYRHVASKDELQVLMMDTAPGEPPRIDPGAEDWRDGLGRWARELRAVYSRHPWALQITAGGPPLEPGQLSWLDAGLRTLRDTGLGPGDKMGVIMVVVYYVRGEAQLSSALVKGSQQVSRVGREPHASYGRTLARLIDPERFPALAELIAAGVFDSDDDDDFEFGLVRILDGIEALIDSGGRVPR
jgi:AcrR family transcriptional regulator